MKIIKNTKLQLAKYLLFILALTLVVLWNKDLIAPILTQLKTTSFSTLFAICSLSLGYFVMEGINLWRLSLPSVPSFQVRQGIGCAFYACFYRTVTLGSASFAAGMYYLNKHKVPLANTLSIITVQYVSYKIAIAIFCILSLVFDYPFLHQTYAHYLPYLLLGIILIALIAVVLLLFCLSARFHRLLLWGIQKIQHIKRFQNTLGKANEQLVSLRAGTQELLADRKRLLFLILRNLIRLLFWYTLPCFLFHSTTPAQIWHSISIASILTALAGVIPTPAGIGSTEVLFTAFYAPISSASYAASQMLLYRFATFLFPFLIGIVAVLWYHRTSFDA